MSSDNEEIDDAELAPEALTSDDIEEEDVYDWSTGTLEATPPGDVEHLNVIVDPPNNDDSHANEKALFDRASAVIDHYAADQFESLGMASPPEIEDEQPSPQNNNSNGNSNDVENLELAAGDEPTETLQQPSVRRESNLADSASAENKGGHGRRGWPRALVPGAVYVRWRAPGLRPGIFLQHLRREAQARSTPPEEPSSSSGEAGTENVTTAPCAPVATTSAEESAPAAAKVHLQTFYRFACIVIFLLVGVTVGAVVMHGKEGTNDEIDSTSRFSPYTKNCNALYGQARPNFMSQCQCSGVISFVGNDITDRYHSLQASFMHTLLPDFHERLDSCSPQNQALVWLASGDGNPTSPTMRQRYLLTLLFIMWNGPNWASSSSWLSKIDECTWIGVTCDDVTRNVVKINLVGRQLSGNLGSDVVLLTSLTSLSLAQNSLQGTLPLDFVQLANLREISLSFNDLTGSIPNEYGAMPQLSSLNIRNNHLVGTLPPELGMLTGLEVLQLSNNNINGTIPPEYGQLQSIQVIALDNNTLTGVIPTEIGLWQQVSNIDVSFNHLGGSTIPSEIGLLSTLKTISFLECKINGTIPEALFGMTGLHEFIATGNNFHGTISTLIGQLGALTNLFLGGNSLTGTVPHEIGKTSNLRYIFFNGNKLNGTIPTEVSLLPLATLDLRGNTFTGSIAKEICSVVTPVYCYNGYWSNLKCNCCNCPGGAYED